MNLKSPFPYFGGKRRIAHEVWRRFGDVPNYVEPFFGSGAVLLNRPLPFDGVETVNDKDGLLANFWRALKADPEQVAHFADWPVNENDLHARHSWLVGQKEPLQAKLEGDADYFDCKVAGWWVWGIACWIGGEFCSGNGPWKVVEVDGERQLVHLGSAGQGVNRRLAHLGNAGRGVNRRRDNHSENLAGYFRELAERLRHVRVCCGDWTRVMGGDTGEALRLHFVSGNQCAIFLDPPYADTAKRCNNIYAHDCLSVAHDVREWAIKHGDDKRYRIALCGFDGEHEMPDSWAVIVGKAGGGNGYGGQSKDGKYKNKGRERIWFSPHCLPGNSDIEIDPETQATKRNRGLFDLAGVA